MGTTYGGNGTTTFQLPNLQGRVPIHQGTNPYYDNPVYVIGQTSGEASHTLLLTEMPTHTHTPQASSSAASTGFPTGAVTLAEPSAAVGDIYGPASSVTPMAAQALTNAGLSQLHSNMQPYLVLTFCIALAGIYPSQN
jgi:microcystin-dependent protein